MKPKSPFMQSFDQLPEQLPLYVLENAFLPGSELPLELSTPGELAMFLDVLKSNQLVGLVQPRTMDVNGPVYLTGCAGRIRQYRERKDGRLNIMLTGLCRYRIMEELPAGNGYRVARVDWSGYENDYLVEDVDASLVKNFMATLRNYFDRHKMQADWGVLNKLHIEQVVNNLVMIINLDSDSKQRLLEAPTVTQRVELFASLLQGKADPILAPVASDARVN